jgi:hypothetical protein
MLKKLLSHNLSLIAFMLVGFMGFSSFSLYAGDYQLPERIPTPPPIGTMLEGDFYCETQEALDAVVLYLLAYGYSAKGDSEAFANCTTLSSPIPVAVGPVIGPPSCTAEGRLLFPVMLLTEIPPTPSTKPVYGFVLTTTPVCLELPAA